MAVVIWQIVLLAGVAALTGVASAALAVSAYLIIFPVLVTTFGTPALDAVFLCFIVDVLNGLAICIRYRACLKDIKHPSIIIVASIACLAAAIVCAVMYGVQFIQNNGGSLGVGVSAVVIAMGIGFIIRAVRARRAFVKSQTDEMRVVHAAGFGHVSSGVETRDYTMEGKEPDVESAMQGELEEEITHPKRTMFIRDILTVFGFALMGVLVGSFGFGGGNGMAIMLLILQRWRVLPSTAASGLISAVVITGLIILLLYRGDIAWENIKLATMVAVPVDFVAVVITARYAYHLAEHKITMLVGVLLVILGSFAVAYGLIIG